MSNIENLKADLRSLALPAKAEFFPKFFKTGAGQYGEGDVFIGVTVPNQRQVAKKYKDLDSGSIEKLLHSPIHEERLTALFILVNQFQKADQLKQEFIVKLYLTHLGPIGLGYVLKKWGPQKLSVKRSFWGINNWDLVDSSAPYIVGAYLQNRDRALLYQLAASKNLWERRVAIVSTGWFIRQNDLTDTFKLATKLMKDDQDLIYKATGWMLREAGKRNQKILVKFLNQNAAKMPRTMLRYAIEHFSPKERQVWMNSKLV